MSALLRYEDWPAPAYEPYQQLLRRWDDMQQAAKEEIELARESQDLNFVVNVLAKYSTCATSHAVPAPRP